MLFNSLEFLAFFPVVAGIYFLLPRRWKNLWLLAASYYFYMCWNPIFVFLLLFVTGTTWLLAIALDAKRAKRTEKGSRCQKLCVAAGVILNLGVLGYFKYANFFISNINRILANISSGMTFPALDLLLPIGISFYIFQALGYLIDVYRGDCPAEKNFFRYALFVSFFPQIAAGPIGRSTKLLPQFKEEHRFSFERARSGFMLMLWGYFLKIVIADRIAILVDTVYDHYTEYTGWYFILASLLFSIQIYCDFAGYSTIAAGAAEIMGFRLGENFNAPYLARTTGEFWRRWHMSLSTWFRDYLYIPLGGNRKGKLRKYINLLIVFGLSGLWHGASWHFIIWGVLNGSFQIVGDLLKPMRDRAVSILHLDRKTFSHKLYKTAATFCLMTFAWVFFRANSFREGLKIVMSMLTARNIWVLFDGSVFGLGLDEKDFIVMLLSIAILFAADWIKATGIVIRETICRQEFWFRWLILAGGITGILLFGIWGSGYDAASFIYFRF